MSMSGLIEAISNDVDRIVVDKSGFTALFNFLLDNARATHPAASGPSIFVALEEQLGLRLRPTTAQVDVLVIDRAERPSEQ